MKYYAHAVRIGKSILDRILLSQKKIRLRLVLKDGFKSFIFNFSNMFYLFNSLCNLFSLGFFNNSGIYYNNKNKTFYKIHIRQILTQTQYWRNNYLFKPLNFSNKTVNLLKINNIIY